MRTIRVRPSRGRELHLFRNRFFGVFFLYSIRLVRLRLFLQLSLCATLRLHALLFHPLHFLLAFLESRCQ